MSQYPLPVPWYLSSPSVMSMVFYGSLILYSSHRLKPRTLREWGRAVGLTSMVLGIVVAVFDSMWCAGQGLKWQSLHPGDLSWLYSLLRDITVILFFTYETRSSFAEKGFLNVRGFKWSLIFIPFLFTQFLLAPNPNWTDWTYGIRYGYPVNEIAASYLIGFPTKLMMAYVYFKLWKKL